MRLSRLVRILYSQARQVATPVRLDLILTVNGRQQTVPRDLVNCYAGFY